MRWCYLRLGCELLHCVPDIHSPSLCPPAGGYRSPSRLEMQCQRVVILRGAICGIQRLRNSGNMACTFMQSVATLSPFVLRCRGPSAFLFVWIAQMMSGCVLAPIWGTHKRWLACTGRAGSGRAGQGRAGLQWARATAPWSVVHSHTVPLSAYRGNMGVSINISTCIGAANLITTGRLPASGHLSARTSTSALARSCLGMYHPGFSAVVRRWLSVGLSTYRYRSRWIGGGQGPWVLDWVLGWVLGWRLWTNGGPGPGCLESSPSMQPTSTIIGLCSARMLSYGWMCFFLNMQAAFLLRVRHDSSFIIIIVILMWVSGEVSE